MLTIWVIEHGYPNMEWFHYESDGCFLPSGSRFNFHPFRLYAKLCHSQPKPGLRWGSPSGCSVACLSPFTTILACCPRQLLFLSDDQMFGQRYLRGQRWPEPVGKDAIWELCQCLRCPKEVVAACRSLSCLMPFKRGSKETTFDHRKSHNPAVFTNKHFIVLKRVRILKARVPLISLVCSMLTPRVAKFCSDPDPSAQLHKVIVPVRESQTGHFPNPCIYKSTITSGLIKRTIQSVQRISKYHES